MRIVGGRWGGRALVSPAGRVRPTAEALRVAAMELAGEALVRGRVLDLFAGSGALGLEALSRGAASVDFVENGAPALHALKANIAALRARDRTRLFRMDAVRFLDGVEAAAYAVAFADPPYGSGLVARTVDRWRTVGFAGLLVMEHAADQDPPPGGRTHRFEDSALTVYRRSGTGGRAGLDPEDRPRPGS